MFKRYFEITLMTILFFWLVYFIIYTFFLDDICNNFSNNNTKKTNPNNVSNTITNYYSKKSNLNKEEVFKKISSCTDSFVCIIDSIEREKNTNITDWKCIKKEVEKFEYNYYINKLKIFNF